MARELTFVMVKQKIELMNTEHNIHNNNRTPGDTMKSLSMWIIAALMLTVSVFVTGCQSHDMSMTGPSDEVTLTQPSADVTNDYMGGKSKTPAPAPADTSRYVFAR